MSLYEWTPEEVPAIRIAQAISKGVQNNFRFEVGGGLGDTIWAEPTVRYALDTFKDCKVSVSSRYSEVFEHLLDRPEGLRTLESLGSPDERYFQEDECLRLYTYPTGSLANQFLNPTLMHLRDYISIAALRGQLPPGYHQLKLPNDKKWSDYIDIPVEKCVVISTGIGWESKTLPYEWIVCAILEVVRQGMFPVLVGKNSVPLPNYAVSKCLDKRETTGLKEFLTICKDAIYLITNDSAPLHIAQASRVFTYVIPTVKPPWLLVDNSSWVTFKYRQPMWERFLCPPNDKGSHDITKCPPGTTINDYLPDPESVGNWLAMHKGMK